MFKVCQDDRTIGTFKTVKDALIFMLSKSGKLTYYLDDESQTIATYDQGRLGINVNYNLKLSDNWFALKV